jgi:hypothetical protein
LFAWFDAERGHKKDTVEMPAVCKRGADDGTLSSQPNKSLNENKEK